MRHRAWVLGGGALAAAVLGFVASTGSAQPPAPSPVERAGQLIGEAQSSFARVRDYAGTLVRQERINHELQPEQFIQFRIRQQPFSVALKWASPRHLAGQEAIFVSGKNNNEIRAHGSGLMSIAGWVSLATNDPRVMKNSRHSIMETGIGNMISIISRTYEINRQLPENQVKVTFADYAFQQKPCTRMEVVHRVFNPQLYCHRCVVFFDKETKLPVRVEVFDWPAKNGNPNGELLECYSYINLRLNVGLTDESFAESDK
jgi:hypothetical protein